MELVAENIIHPGKHMAMNKQPRPLDASRLTY